MAAPFLPWKFKKSRGQARSRCPSGSRHLLLDFLEDSLVVRRDFRIFRAPLVADDPACIQHEHGSLRHAVEAERSEAIVEHPIRGADRLVPITEQRIVEAGLLLE